MRRLGMTLLPRVSAFAALLASSTLLVFGCDDDSSASGGEPIDSSGGPVDDDDGGGGTDDSDSTNPTNPTDPTSDGTGGCGGCIDAAGECQPGSFNEACGVLGEACAACEGSTVCAEGVCLEPPSCNPDNCNGCCDGNTCVEGNVPDACGTNGGQCQSCPNNASCDAGVCNLACQDSCDGCCDGNTCVDFGELSEDNCGVGGDACQPCGNGFECIGGECVSTACIATCGGCCEGDQCLGGDDQSSCGADGATCQACGANTVCGEAGCEPDPMALWNIRILDGVVALTNEDGDSWDAFNGLPDPYVSVEVVGLSGETEVVDGELFPVWDEIVLEEVNTVQLQGEVEFTVWDSDALFDENMATCTLSIEDDMFGGTFDLTCSNAKSGFEFWTITFSIESV